MKAVVFDAHGPLDNMRHRDAPEPKPGPKDSVIRVRALALDGFDPMILHGIPGLKVAPRGQRVSIATPPARR